MPRASLVATTTTTTKADLSPRLVKKLLVECRSYQKLKEQRDALDAAMDGHKARAAAIRDEAGEKAVKVEGFTVRRVEPTRSTLDKMKLVELGCAMAWIEEATTTKPTKPYDRIICPGEKEEF